MTSTLADSCDRFPLGLAGHVVPVDGSVPGQVFRPWGMNSAVVMPVFDFAAMSGDGDHRKPTKTKRIKQATKSRPDGGGPGAVPDEVTVTVTD